MDVGDFLRELGLRQYEDAFRDNEIDIGVLPKLTAEDLKDLGITMVGDRGGTKALSESRRFGRVATSAAFLVSTIYIDGLTRSPVEHVKEFVTLLTEHELLSPNTNFAPIPIGRWRSEDSR
jgi:SAM domain (Sterile alpha motif)